MAATRQLDPMAYIESAFLDRLPPALVKLRRQPKKGEKPKGRFRKTKLSAPRPRMNGEQQARPVIHAELRELIENLPRNLEFLAKFYNDEVTANYYSHGFKESRSELIRRLIDPELTLEEVSRLLGVCPATIRRYTNKGWLEHHRTKGGQRRFRLSALAKHVEKHGRLPKE